MDRGAAISSLRGDKHPLNPEMIGIVDIEIMGIEINFVAIKPNIPWNQAGNIPHLSLWKL